MMNANQINMEDRFEAGIYDLNTGRSRHSGLNSGFIMPKMAANSHFETPSRRFADIE